MPSAETGLKPPDELESFLVRRVTYYIFSFIWRQKKLQKVVVYDVAAVWNIPLRNRRLNHTLSLISSLKCWCYYFKVIDFFWTIQGHHVQLLFFYFQGSNHNMLLLLQSSSMVICCRFQCILPARCILPTERLFAHFFLYFRCLKFCCCWCIIINLSMFGSKEILIFSVSCYLRCTNWLCKMVAWNFRKYQVSEK